MPNVVVYARSSTGLQKRRNTAATQVAACLKLADAAAATVLGTFVDEATSGRVPITERSAGSRLLRLCETGVVTAIVVSHVDRLSRSAADHSWTRLAELGVQIWAVSNGRLDTGPEPSELRRALDFAQAELPLIADRMGLGRDRVVALGKWVGGPIPFGYDLDADGKLRPSDRIVAGHTEADIVRSVFRALADGSSTISEARRLQTLGVVPLRRYSQGVVVSASGRWLPSRVNQMVRNTLYIGRHRFASRFGPIERMVPALIDEDLWQAAQATITANRPKIGETRNYLLRGFMFCAQCGQRFQGTTISSGSWRDFYYRCAGGLGIVNPDIADRCRAKNIPAVWIEQQVLDECARRGIVWDRSDFVASRRVVEASLRRITVSTTLSAKSKEASIVVQFTDASSVMIAIKRRPRGDRKN